MDTTNPQPPLVPQPDDESLEEATTTDPDIIIDDDGDERLDPDVNDDLIDSADADRLAAGGEVES